MADIDRYAVKSGNLIAEDGSVKNIVTLLGGGEPISEEAHDIRRYAPISGRVLGEDGKVYNLVDLLQNYSGGGGTGPVNWSDVQNKPSTFPPSAHSHDERYYTKADIDNAGYLLAQPDGETVEVQGGELKARALSGMQLGVSQLNSWLAGTEGNIQEQINSVLDAMSAIGRPLKFLADVETHSDMMSITTMQDSDFVIVLSDETRDNDRTWYVYRGDLATWRYMGSLSLTNKFASLVDTPNTYDDGKYLRSGINGLYYDALRYGDLEGKPNSTIAQIDDTVTKRHEHANKDKLDKISEGAGGVLTYNGEEYVRVSDLPTLQAKQRLFAYRSGSDQTLTAGTDCVFNTKHSGNIPYDTSTGIFTLEAGKLYRVEVAGSLYTSGWVILQLVNAETNSIVNTISRGIWMDVNPSNSNWHESSAGPLKTYITPAATRGYKIRATTISGEASLRSNYVSLEIVEM